MLINSINQALQGIGILGQEYQRIINPSLDFGDQRILVNPEIDIFTEFSLTRPLMEAPGIPSSLDPRLIPESLRAKIVARAIELRNQFGSPYRKLAQILEQEFGVKISERSLGEWVRRAVSSISS